uniref:Uncharacterized protein n=1 Tax=Anguilla anguilla TaxID=7936 RepID=A0A0E9RX94_ANGAN
MLTETIGNVDSGTRQMYVAVYYSWYLKS